MAEPTTYPAVFGLGNPGPKYQLTRHNIGFLILDAWALDLGLKFQEERSFQSEFVRVPNGPRLIKPLTFMNGSGEAVGSWARMYQWEPKQVLVVVDDVNLDLGQIRIRRSGSSGGQNGLKSIEAHLGTDQYPRIRCGVGKQPPAWALERWVLSKFTPAEDEAVFKLIQTGRQAIECCLTEGIDVAMNKYNGNSPTSP